MQYNKTKKRKVTLQVNEYLLRNGLIENPFKDLT